MDDTLCSIQFFKVFGYKNWADQVIFGETVVKLVRSFLSAIRKG